MKFGSVPVAAAEGAILAHSIATPSGRLRKGSVIGAAERQALDAGGIRHVTVARLDPDDVGENEAAGRLAAALCGAGLTRRDPFTGRANLHADGPGLLAVDAAAIAAVNAVDPMVTVATLPEWQRVTEGTMAATIKIIAYGVDGVPLDRACAAGQGALSLRPPVMDRAELIVTTVDGAPIKVDPVTARLERLGVSCRVIQTPHQSATLAEALRAGTAPLRLILTASATSDVQDVGPAALRAADGTLTRFGMPVDPGNLLFLGDIPGAKVIGLPGCARSPALNGADWILERVACGLDVTSADIASMGVGGLLKEIPTRPQPRDRAAK